MFSLSSLVIFTFLQFLQEPNTKFQLVPVRGLIYSFTVNILGIMAWCFLLVINIWIYFINVIISFFVFSWQDLHEYEFLETDLNFAIFLRVHEFYSHCTIDAYINISQPHANFLWLLIFFNWGGIYLLEDESPIIISPYSDPAWKKATLWCRFYWVIV